MVVGCKPLRSDGIAANKYSNPHMTGRMYNDADFPKVTLIVRKLLVLCSFLFIASAQAGIDNFRLLDHRGDSHELYYYSDASAILLMVHGNGCPIVRNLLPDFEAVRADYESRGVRFFLLNANLQDTYESIREEVEEWAVEAPILVDDTQLIAESLELTRTAEVLLIDPKSWEIVYRGPLSDRVDFERQLDAPKRTYLRDSLDALLSGEEVSETRIPAKGCLINLPSSHENHQEISYSETIAPLLRENCVMCHQEGGIGSWAMNQYLMVQGFAPMIREVVRTGRMPPWHADPHVGEWRNDHRLSINERRTLVHWIEAGAPRGDGPDPLLEPPPPLVSEHDMGEADLVIELTPFKVPATGVVDYQYPYVANPLDRDVWIKSMVVEPGSVEVVHHALIGTSQEMSTDNDEIIFDNYLGGYAPGTQDNQLPEGTGVFVPKGGYFNAQMHYTPYGRTVTDSTRLLLYFHDEPPKTYLRHGVVINPLIHIPPGAKAHEEWAYFEFERDAILYSVLPHSHYRGKSSKFWLDHPDGTRELILSVPNYDFNWQRGYEFAEPRRIAAGTRLVHSTIYDNSRQNPGNPDASRPVPWGLQSQDEMLYGDFLFTWVEETADNPIHDNDRFELVQTMGFLDRDMDGVLRREELPKGWRARMARLFEAGDIDQDGALNLEEYVGASLAMRQRRKEGEQAIGQ